MRDKINLAGRFTRHASKKQEKTKRTGILVKYMMHKVILIVKVPVVRPKRSTRSANKKTTEDDSLTHEE